jgi:hypothetical protein
MARVAVALTCTAEQRAELMALARSRTAEARLAQQAKIVHGLKSTYKRHGTVNLFAALEAATGVIRGKTTQTKKRVDFQAFMTDLVSEQPPDREIQSSSTTSPPTRRTTTGWRHTRT